MGEKFENNKILAKISTVFDQIELWAHWPGSTHCFFELDIQEPRKLLKTEIPQPIPVRAQRCLTSVIVQELVFPS